MVQAGSDATGQMRSRAPLAACGCAKSLGSKACAGVAAGMLALGAGCREPDPPRLVARVGCGIEGDDFVDTLRVQARGDFPTHSGTQVVFSGGEETLAWGGLPVDGVTVEGLFGQTVEAVGRTARLADEGEIPVYFAPVDSVCPVKGNVGPRESVAAAVGPTGDVLITGGRDAEGDLLDEVVHLHDEEGRVALLSNPLPAARVGHTVHALGERRFVVVGGASTGPDALGHVVLVDLDDEVDPVSAEVPVPLAADEGPARAYHAGARSPDGRILVAGGCTRLDPEAECWVEEEPGVHGTAMWIDAVGSGLVFRPGPDLVVPRYGAFLSFQRDGVAYLAGGWDEAGRPVHVVERYRPDSIRFLRYGGDLGEAIDDDVAVVGATVLEGGVVVLVLADGRIHWLTEHERDTFEPWSGWCGSDEPCFADLPGSGASVTRRGVVTLPGERVLADGVLLPVGGLGYGGTDVLDPFVSSPGHPVTAERRVGTMPVVLADGSVLLVGGRDPTSGELATPLALRMRPELDGPDERIPEVDRAERGSLMVHDLGRAERAADGLNLLVTFDSVDPRFPEVRARARGFRSASFRFDMTVHVGPEEVVPYLVLEHGGVEAVSVAFEPDAIQAYVRDAQERVQSFSCASTGLRFSDPQVLQVEVRPGGVLVRNRGETLGQCPLTNEPRQWSVGVGASGAGDVLVSGLRLTRL
jgi:hypothetical protein